VDKYNIKFYSGIIFSWRLFRRRSRLSSGQLQPVPISAIIPQQPPSQRSHDGDCHVVDNDIRELLLDRLRRRRQQWSLVGQVLQKYCVSHGFILTYYYFRVTLSIFKAAVAVA